MPKSFVTLRLAIPLILVLGGCTSVSEYIHNGCKVGPDYKQPPAPIATAWIDAADKHVHTDYDDLAGWWTVFDDPLLNDLVAQAYRQNLTLREAGYRILVARAQLGITTGEFFPQQQDVTGSYRRFGSGDSFFSQWNLGFNLAWEIDFWGRFRRAIQAAEATLDASVFDYDEVLVTLLSDTATAYVQIRTTQERIRLLDAVIQSQEDVFNFIEQRLREGKGATDLDRAQALSNLEQSRAQRNQFLIDERVAENQLCILLGIPVENLKPLLDSGPKKSIPIAPDYVVAGIPADLLRRRPDVRRAEREAAAQAELIGIAETDWYPAVTISGTLGWQAQTFSKLFSSHSLNSVVGPSFQWNLLNYGRILNNVRLQDAEFRRLVTVYQNSVLQADLEVENGIVTFLQAHQRADDLRRSVDESWVALQVIVAQYQAGLSGIDFNRYATIQQNLILQQDLWAQAQGQICLGLIQVYRGLGGGWQIKCASPPDKRGILSPAPVIDEQLPPGGGEQLTPATETMPAGTTGSPIQQMDVGPPSPEDQNGDNGQFPGPVLLPPPARPEDIRQP